MELASCVATDPATASWIFLSITAAFIVMAAFAIGRLSSMSAGHRPVEQAQTA
ncbi:hypothetical protein [Mesorhizobium sp.]|uniref:hypothetical protein n=1 Tax=Mesorhizobium sp. TaxID=1871066 RepID=UPI00257DA586|nr:hypothetical protein [Mesorhizobium sp.]